MTMGQAEFLNLVKIGIMNSHQCFNFLYFIYSKSFTRTPVKIHL